jgi:phage protein D
MNYATQEQAEAAAQADFNRRERGKITLSLTVTGDPKIFAEAPLTVTGIREGVNGDDWIITRVEHTLDSGGFVSRIEAEKKTGYSAGEEG